MAQRTSKKKTSKKAAKKTTKQSSNKKVTKKASVKNLDRIQRVAIIYRSKGREAYQLAQKLSKWLEQRKVNTYYLSEQKSLSHSTKLNKKDLGKLDLIVVLGGDGTYLYAVSQLGGRNIPVLGVNLGSLGFLTETRSNELFTIMEIALKGGMDRQVRSLLRVRVMRKNKVAKEYLALNDVVLERGPYSRLIKLGVYSNEFLVSEIKADGLIICTPTGSTAYNLAAGGPIIHPDCRGIAITPICPHSLTHRPIILPDDQCITLKIQEDMQKACFMIDGQQKEVLSPNDEVKIRLAMVTHTLLRPPSRSYYDLLSTKLQFGKRI